MPDLSRSLTNLMVVACACAHFLLRAMGGGGEAAPTMHAPGQSVATRPVRQLAPLPGSAGVVLGAALDACPSVPL